MKWIGKILAAFILLMAAALVIFLVTFGQKKYKERDMVYFNDLLYELSDDYKAGASIEELEKKYECDIVLKQKISASNLRIIIPKGHWYWTYRLMESTSVRLFGMIIILKTKKIIMRSNGW